MKQKLFRMAAFTLLEIMIVVAIIGLLAAIAIPSFVSAKGKAQQTACVLNLKQLTGAKQRWSLDNSVPGTAIPSEGELFGPHLYIESKPSCPAGGVYTLNAVDEKPVCSVPNHTY